MWWLVLWPVFVALSYADALAEVSPLRGLESVYLLVEELSAGSVVCGVDEQTIRSSIGDPLANGGLKIGSSDNGPTLAANVTTAYAKDVGLCTSSINLLLYVTQSVSIADTHNETFVPVMLWHGGMLLVTGKAQHREQLKATLEDMGKKLVVDWIAAQH
jgi:hypothetical protein